MNSHLCIVPVVDTSQLSYGSAGRPTRPVKPVTFEQIEVGVGAESDGSSFDRRVSGAVDSGLRKRALAVRCRSWRCRRLLADWLCDGGAFLDFLIDPSVRGRTTATVFGASRRHPRRR